MTPESQSPRPRHRVVMITIAIPPYHAGAGTQAWYLAEQLTQRGVDVSFLTPRMGPDPKREVIDGIRVDRLSAPFFRRSLRNLAYAVSLAVRLLFRRDYDVAHFHDFGLLFTPAAFVARMRGKLVVMKTASVGLEFVSRYQNNPVLRWLFIRSCLLPHFVICQTREMLENAATLIPRDRLVQQLNGVDTAAFSPATRDQRVALRQKTGTREGEFVALYIGAVTEPKRCLTLVQTAPLVAKHLPGFKVRLVGPHAEDLGANKPSDLELRELEEYLRLVKEEITRSESADLVEFCGPQRRVKDFIDSSDVFVMPSSHEGSCNAVLESMSCELPVIVSDIDAFAHLTHRDEVLKHALDDAEDLAKQILTLCGDNSLRGSMVRSARRFIDTTVSFDAVASKYLELYGQSSGSNQESESLRRA